MTELIVNDQLITLKMKFQKNWNIMSKQITYLNYSKWQKQQQTTQMAMYSASY